jgi:hypothetical protein
MNSSYGTKMPTSTVQKKDIQIPDFLKKHKDELSFTAYGNPFFTYKYKKTGLVETDAELLMGRTEELLEEMKELVLETEPVQNN